MFYTQVLKPVLESIYKYGNRNAFCINNRFYTYNELAIGITKIRLALQREEIINKNIGLIANDDLETYASIFAIWLEGNSYVPLHPIQPIERNLEIINQAEISLLLDSNPKTIIPSIQTIDTKELGTCLVNKLQQNIVSDDFLAYILFTSGSTGKPKGVQISRRNLGAFMKSFWETGIQIYESDRCLQCFDLTFDVSVQSYLVPLSKGACTYTIPHDQIKYSYVYGLLEDHQLTFGAMAPSMIRYFRPYFDEIKLPSMRYNIITAEASPLNLIVEWSKCIPNAIIYDFYGPTETTIYCTFYKVKRGINNKQLNGMLSIGKTMSGLIAIIIDDDKKLLGFNQKGELCISGDQVTPGYWKNPEKNRASFFSINFNGTMIRFYRTGDSCYFDEDGDIMLSGRIDHQVKIQGYRIELGEIEYHARDFVKGRNVIAFAVENSSEDTEIVLAIEDSGGNADLILKYLRLKLPSYMIPSKIKFITPFPLNNSSKIDRIKLKTLL